MRLPFLSFCGVVAALGCLLDGASGRILILDSDEAQSVSGFTEEEPCIYGSSQK